MDCKTNENLIESEEEILKNDNSLILTYAFSNKINEKLIKIKEEILNNNNFLILTHASPDGDTLGSGFALCHALQKINKKAKVLIIGKLPAKYEYMTKNLHENSIAFSSEDYVESNDTIISVDIASPQLLDDVREIYENNIHICLDHHRENSIKAKMKYVDSTAAAAAEIIYLLINVLEIEINEDIAKCLYTGISTDTGCFKYSNTTSTTHAIAADLMQKTNEWKYINKLLFDTKSKSLIEYERLAFNSLEFFVNGKCAIICTTLKMKKETFVDDSDIEGIPNIPCRIEGVLIGITVKESENNACKISVRTNGNVNASDFCKAFGGGGHFAAAGAKISGTVAEVKQILINHVKNFL